MNNTNEQNRDLEQPPKANNLLQPGEKGFQIILFAFGAIAFALSCMLWNKVSAPKVSSAAALPLFVSGLWVVLTFIDIVLNLRSKSRVGSVKGIWSTCSQAIGYAKPKQTFIMICAVIVYCIMLYFKFDFYIATGLFLYTTMCYLTKKNYLKNIIWTSIVLLFVYVVFGLLFGVVFP